MHISAWNWAISFAINSARVSGWNGLNEWSRGVGRHTEFSNSVSRSPVPPFSLWLELPATLFAVRYLQAFRDSLVYACFLLFRAVLILSMCHCGISFFDGRNTCLSVLLALISFLVLLKRVNEAKPNQVSLPVFTKCGLEHITCISEDKREKRYRKPNRTLGDLKCSISGDATFWGYRNSCPDLHFPGRFTCSRCWCDRSPKSCWRS